MTSNDSPEASHPKFWWWVKVISGFMLIAGAVHNILSLTADSVLLDPSLVKVAQFIVLTGAAMFVWHFMLVKRHNNNMERPDQLITRGGLFPWVRHPMYLADFIYYAGLALFWPGLISTLILALAGYALARQSMIEDRWCAELFPNEHQAWAARSRLFIPGLY